MHKILLSIFFSVTFFQGFSQQINLAQGKASSKNYYAEISFDFLRDKIIVHVKIKGKDYKFLLDTGAPNIISKELYNEMNPSVLGTIPVSDANNKKSSSQVVSVPSLNFGGIIFKNTPALVHDLNASKIFKCFKIDGFIGSNMLRSSIIQIDLKNKLIKLTDNKKKLQLNKKNSAKIELIGSQKKPYVWINFKGRGSAKEQVLIDTGMSGFYDLSSKNLPLLQKGNVFDTIARAIGTKSYGLYGPADKKEQLRLLIPEINIANNNFTNLVTTTTNDNNSRIGIDMLSYGNITVDFKNKRFYYNVLKKKINLEEKLASFEPAIADGKLIVGFVWNENLKSKIKFGDQILKINDVDVSKLDICKFITSTSIFKENEKLEILIRKENNEKVLITVDKKYPKR